MKKELYCFTIKGKTRHRIKRLLHLAKINNDNNKVDFYRNLLLLKKFTSLKKYVKRNVK